MKQFLTLFRQFTFRSIIAALAWAWLAVAPALAQHSFTNATPYVQNFNTFAGTEVTVPANWLWTSPNTYGGTYSTASTYTGANGTFALQSSPPPAPTDVAFGGKLGQTTHTLIFNARNATGGTITGFNLSWNVEQYSQCTNPSDIQIAYSINNAAFVDVPSGTVTTQTDTCVNLTQVLSTPKTLSLSGLSLLNTQTIRIRFSFVNTGPNNAHVGIDDFVMTPVIPCTAPSMQANSLAAANVQSNQLTLSWGGGNGNAFLVLVRAGSAVNDAPVNGSNYIAAAAFGSGSQIGSGNYVVYKESGNTTIVTGLMANTTYHFAVFAYNTADFCYNTTTSADNRTNAATPRPAITHQGTSPPSSNITEGSTNNILYQVAVNVVGGTVNLNGLQVSTGGTWTNADISNFKLHYSPNSNFSNPTLLSTVSNNLTGGSQTISFTTNRSLLPGISYLFITCDVKDPATIGNTVSASIAGDASFTYPTNTVTFSNSSFQPGNPMTIVGAPEIQLKNASGENIACGTVFNTGTLTPGHDTVVFLEIHNIGRVDLALNSIILTETSFSNFLLPGGHPEVVAPDDFYALKIIFNPQTPGIHFASLSIANNDSNENPCLITLRGSALTSQEPIFPDVFTPNGDGHNDAFDIVFPPEANGRTYTLEVFNRAGGLLGRITGNADEGMNRNVWDGSPCPDGVYYYRLSYNETVYRGAVTILNSQF